MTTVLRRGATIDIIGGGQLGRMLAMAAMRLGFRTIVLDPQPDCPAAQPANDQIAAAYDDQDALDQLAERSDVVTFEFENIDLGALEQVSSRAHIHPAPWALRVTRDRLVEKTFLREAGIPTAEFRTIANADQLRIALKGLGGKAILKTRQFGYDGKGQVRFGHGGDEPSPEDAMAAVAGTPVILETLVDFDCEISVIVTRGQDRSVHEFEPSLNDHRDGLLSTATVPCGLPQSVIDDAMRCARKVVDKLDYVGTLGLEFFVIADGGLIANEIAPRVHNSGHWTEAACSVSQFEQHIRAIVGWPLAKSVRHSDCVMTNLIGAEIDDTLQWAGDGAVMVHDYGKTETRPGRKMGHVTKLVPR